MAEQDAKQSQSGEQSMLAEGDGMQTMIMDPSAPPKPRARDVLLPGDDGMPLKTAVMEKDLPEDEEASTVPMPKMEEDIDTQPLDRAEVVEGDDTSTQPLNRADDNPDRIVATEGDEVRQLKISCHACGQKLDVTTLEPFSCIECPACGASIIVPAWFDNYLLEEAGGAGGMATVYRALDLALDREVAIKILHQSLSEQVDKSELFLHEARTAATINHYAVVPIYTCGIHNKQAYIVMQYMSGGSLENMLRNTTEPLPLLNVLSWVCDVAAGLENARQHGIVHHDIKPANIMLDSDNKAKIGDFGIAQIITVRTEGDEAAENMTRTWLSPYYTSPEKIRTGVEDYHGDIYSLGATFYHLVTGFPPFQHNDLDELVRMRLTNDPMPPHLQRKEIPVHLSELILSMMSREPEKRPDYIDIQEILNEYISQPEMLSMQYVKLGENHIRETHSVEIQNAGAVSAHYNRIQAEQQKASSPLLMKLIIHFLLSVIVASVTFLLLNKYNKLNALIGYMPYFMQVEKKSTEPEPRLNAQFVEDFQLGAPDNIINGIQPGVLAGKSGKRMQSALQAAYAAYLGTVPGGQTPQEYIKPIAETINKYTSPYERIAYEDNILLINYLAGNISDDEAEHSKYPHAEDFQAKKALAVLLMKLYAEPDMEKEDLQSYLSDFESALSRLDSKSWVTLAFTKRLPVWKLAIRYESAGPDTVEKLFYPRLRELPPEDPAAGDASVKESAGRVNFTELNLEKLQASAEKIRGFGRPVPEYPLAFFTIDHAKEYLSRIADLDENGAERDRLSRLMHIKPFLINVT